MEGTSKWVKWYRILAVIGCGVIVIFSLVSGWKAARYVTYRQVKHDMSIFLPYAGIGCAIAAAELLLSMMLCEFLDNVSFIAHKLADWDYAKAAKDLIGELARDPKAKEIFSGTGKAEQPAEKKAPPAERAEKKIPIVSSSQASAAPSTNKGHAPVAPVKLDQDRVVCPLCNTEQRANRRLCLNCSVPFITEE